ncbi:transmembrane protein 161B [Daktulosphaira vitifoliae]|uniref:transmembrane protein 161B n=1 Tax=Daktulosphaira vitifoliae TaxID=58002 RepID=UPI0021AAD2D4|nr:transmembrane protein 161B [Daktulosphaira vitifoliae]
MAALLGVQLIITMVAINLIHRLSPIYSFARWSLCSTGLVRYIHPTDKELRQILGLKKKENKQKKGLSNGQSNNVDVFQIPKNLEINLQNQPIYEHEIYQLKYFMEYQWLVNFSIYAALVYFSTEIYSYYSSITNEINLSMLWCAIVIVFAFKILISLTMEYFYGGFESVGERSTVVVAGFVYLVISMIILIIDESKLDVRLDTAYKSFNESSIEFLNNHGLPSQGPASKLIVKFCLAIWCAVTGAMFVFPGIRTAKMHWDCLKYYELNCFYGKYITHIIKTLMNLSLISHFLLILLWIKPITVDLLTVKNLSGFNKPLMSVEQFESLRCWGVVFVVIQRLFLMPKYMQAYLNMAYERFEYQKKEAGRITNKELQKQVSVIYYYTCVVVLQYIIPLVMVLFFTFFYKTLGDLNWVQSFNNLPSTNKVLTNNTTLKMEEQYFTIQSLKQIFTVDVYRGIFGFATWWVCFSWFLSLSLGIFYQTYLSA